MCCFAPSGYFCAGQKMIYFVMKLTLLEQTKIKKHDLFPRSNIHAVCNYIFLKLP